MNHDTRVPDISTGMPAAVSGMSTGSKVIRLLRSLVAITVLVLLAVWILQRRLLYHPSHEPETNGLKPWRHGDLSIGFSRGVPSPETVWLFIHGNAGQAADRVCVLPCFSGRDSVFILEYPGYGGREGSPSMDSFNSAAKEAYAGLRLAFPDTPVCVAGESIGTGPVSFLAGGAVPPPDKVVLITPFDTLARAASHHFPFLPVKLLLRDNWDNIRALESYDGPLEIFAAKDDEVIPFECSGTLAAGKPGALFHEIEGGHNEWSAGTQVRIRNP